MKTNPSATRHCVPALWGIKGLGGLLLALLAGFARYDLPIAQAAYHPDSVWGQFLRRYGELPGHALVLLSAGTYLLLGRNLVIRVAMLIPIVLEMVIFGDKFQMPGSFGEGLLVLVLAMVPVTAILVGKRLLSRQQMARASGLVVLAAVLHPLVLVQGLKVLWGRARFRHLAEEGVDFSPWYLPQGLTGHQSFPSGHAAMGVLACFLVLYLPHRLRRIAFVPLLLWAVAVGWSRVVVGAHYASDVTVSLFVGLILLVGFVQWMDGGGRESPRGASLEGRAESPHRDGR